MSRPISSKPGAPGVPAEPFQQMESIMLRQMLKSSGAFEGSSMPGSQLRADLFIETLADAVAKAGGIGIGRMLERQLGGASGSPAAPGPAAARPPRGPAVASPPAHGVATRLRALSAPAPGAGAGTVAGAVGGDAPASSGWDGLEDPSSDAPLPEDPGAASIDDYQPAPRARHPGPSAFISASRALNSYRGRVEAQASDHPPGTSWGNEQP
jgi:Rod binding domain-containing protein